MQAGDAAGRSEAAFEGRAEGLVGKHSRPLVGVFGNGVPEALIAAAGATPVDVRSGPDAETPVHPEIAALVEPFVDDHARLFLHRLLAGRLDHLDLIVFPRDDAAALAAWHYAREIDRLGIARARPRLHLFNLVHRQGSAALRFNRAEAERLLAALGAVPDALDLPAALAAERRRAGALEALAAARLDGRVSGANAMVWRNAGRYLPADTHAELLQSALAAPSSPRPGPRIALLGAPIDAPTLYAAIETLGPIVADPHPMGDIWPAPLPAEDSLDALLIAAADDPFCPRIVPPRRHPDAVISACVAARAEIAAFQLDQHDDLLGWDVPALRVGLAAHGIGFVDLGFRDHRPDAAWCAGAVAALTSAREAA